MRQTLQQIIADALEEFDGDVDKAADAIPEDAPGWGSFHEIYLAVDRAAHELDADKRNAYSARRYGSESAPVAPVLHWWPGCAPER